MDYIDRYKISDQKLGQQFIEPEIRTLPAEKFEAWVANRAERLTKETNAFLDQLRNGVQ
jgi:hypothetical protein